jgi:transcriptional regulator with XRE-family HTH domain
MSNTPTPWDQLGAHLQAARRDAGLTQSILASRAGLRQRDISLIEQGRWQPSLRVLTNLARQLDVPLQHFLTGRSQLDQESTDLTFELRQLGIIDLDISHAVVPGAFREPEETWCLALAGNRPDPRVVEALPFVLLHHHWRIRKMLAFARMHDRRIVYRTAWLAEIAQLLRERWHVHQTARQQSQFSKLVQFGKKPAERDDLGSPALVPERLPPVYKRWNILYSMKLADFEKRGHHLHELFQRFNPRTMREVSR